MLEQLRYVRLPVDDLAGAARYAHGRARPRADRPHRDARDLSFGFPRPHAGLRQGRARRAVDRSGSALSDRSRCRALRPAQARHRCRRAARRRTARCAKCRAMLWFRDFSGNRIELVVRPLNSGWRYFPSRDAGVTGLQDVILRSTDIEKDLSIWTRRARARRCRDYAGDAAYLRFRRRASSHRAVSRPSAPASSRSNTASRTSNLLMRNSLRRCRTCRSPILHGPGRRPASDQLFLTLRRPDRRACSASSPKARRRRSGAPAAAISRRSRGPVLLGQRMQDPRIRRVRGWPQPRRAASA